MTTLLVLNPNTQVAMTERVVAQVRLAAPGVRVVAVTAQNGSPVIDSATRFDAAAASVVGCFERRVQRVDGVLLACFGDPGLEALRAHASVPVVGLAEAAVGEAGRDRRRFAIITAGAAWHAILQRRVADFGMAGQLVGVYTLPFNGQTVLDAPLTAIPAWTEACAVAQRDGAETVIAGGAAFAGLTGHLPAPLPVIDCIEAGTRTLLTRVGAANGPH